MIYNNDYIKTLLSLEINKNSLEKIYSKFLQKFSLEDLSKVGSWWNMIDVIDTVDILLDNSLHQYLRENIMVATIFPKQSVRPHIDLSDNSAAINIPFLNCNTNTITTFYEHPENKTMFRPRPDVFKLARQLVKLNELTPKFNFSLTDCPVLFRTDKPHSVVNNGDDLRVMLSWRFKEIYSWEDAVEICKSHQMFAD